MTTPNGTGITNRGTNYADGSQVTSGNLKEHVDNAVFNNNAVDGVTLGLNASSPKALFVKNAGIDTAQLKDNAVTTVKITDNNVTLAKVEQLADQKVVANFTGSTANASETGLVIGGSGSDGLLFDNDTLLNNEDTPVSDATRGATQQSIKAYVDSIKPNIVTSTKLDAATLSVTRSTYADFPTLETAITSRYQNTKFMVTGFISMGFHSQDSDCIVKAQYKVGSGAYQDFNLATGASNRVAGHFAIGQNADNNTGIDSEAFSIPTPAITNSAGDVITFKLQVTDVNASRTLYINREQDNDSDDNYTRRVISTLTVQEV
jgi:hypothetical protein